MKPGKHICGPSSCGYPAADGTQWTDSAPGLHGSWIDESLLLPSFFPAPPKPPPPPPPPKPAHFTLSGDGMFILPAGGETIALTVPVAVPLAAGAWVEPSALRLSCSSPATFEYALGNAEPAAWQALSIDFGRSPTLVPITDSGGNPYPVVKIIRTDKNPAPVTGDFA